MVAKTSAAAARPAPDVLPYPMPAGMFIADLDGVLRGVTPACAQMLEREVAELCGMQMDELLALGDTTTLASLRMEVAQGRDTGIQTDVTLHTTAGHSLRATLYLSRLLSADRPVLLQGLLLNHSLRDQKENAESLQDERRRRVTNLISLGEMASSMAHEINQPLTAITALAQTCVMLLKKGGDPGYARMLALVENMAQQAMRTSQVVKRIRSFVTARALELEDTPVHTLIESARQLAAVELRAAATRLVVDAPRDLPKVNVDLLYLQQVMMNLIRNAVQAMAALPPTERILMVAAHQAGDAMVITFDDRGPGVPEAQRSQLFEPFFTTKPDGIGIGLSTGQRILQSHGGSLSFESNAHGGARFIMTLPVAGAAQPASNEGA